MAVEETKKDLFLKRVQVTIAILGGLVTLVLGVYNIRKYIINKEEEAPKTVIIQQQAPQQSAVKTALEEAGASWIKKLAPAETQ